jgi:hypothetical protein
MTLLRIQRRRARGWRQPPNTIYVGRPSDYGNRYVIGQSIQHIDSEYRYVIDATMACRLFAEWVEWQLQHFPTWREGIKQEIGGHNLSCWCRLCPKHKDGKPLNECCADCAPCHADVLGELSNDFVCEAA